MVLFLAALLNHRMGAVRYSFHAPISYCFPEILSLASSKGDSGQWRRHGIGHGGLEMMRGVEPSVHKWQLSSEFKVKCVSMVIKVMI